MPRLYDIITRAERQILRDHFGATLESRTIRATLHAHGLRYCRACDRVKSVTAFGTCSRTYRTPAGYQSRCKSCARARWRAGNVLVEAAPFVKATADVQRQRQQRGVRRWYLLTQGALDICADVPMRKASEFIAPVHHKFGDVKPQRRTVAQ